MTRTRWTDDLIESRLRQHAVALGRMPSANELAARGSGPLASRISANGGYRYWANRLKVPMKASGTLAGQTMEAVVADMLRADGITVERQTTKAPYDILAGGSLRIDVKSAHYNEYRNRHTGAITRGYAFAGLKSGATCDVFVLLCMTPSDVIETCFVIPAKDAPVSTITITPRSLRGAGKWSRFMCNQTVLAETVRALL